MYRKLFALSLFIVLTAITGSAQDTAGVIVTRGAAMPRISASYLGVQTVEVTKQNYTRFGLSEVRGVAVDSVMKDSPAEKAGIQNGDVVIRFDDETVSSVSKLMRLIGETAPDHKAKVTVLRNGGERDIEVTIGKREMPSGFFSSGGGIFPAEGILIPRSQRPPIGQNIPVTPRVETFPQTEFPQVDDNGGTIVWRGAAARSIGVSISALSKQLAEYFGITDGKGLLVRDVRADSPAAKGGIKAGDVIVEIDGKKMAEGKNLIEAVNEKTEGTISVTIVRDKSRQTLTVEPAKSVEKYLVSPENK